jgi:integrase
MAAEPKTRTRRSRSRPEGIVRRHARSCPTRDGARCVCTPTLQAQVWSPLEQKTIRKTFATLAEAKAWRQESQVALRNGTLRAPSSTTLAEAAEEWLEAAQAGVVHTRSGDRYKPSALRSYQQVLQACVLPRFGRQKLTAISSRTLQDLVDDLARQGLAPSTIRNTLLPLRAIYRRALNRGEVAINPTLKLTLPAVRGRRDRIARPQEATRLIQALPPADQALWATAFYAGLRLGELQALDWAHLDLDQNLIQVERSWDHRAGFIEPKSRSGKRRVPITNTLRNHLLSHRLRQGKGGTGLVFPNSRGDKPFNPSTISLHTKRAWTQAGLQPITLHQCRHSYAAYMIAAGINTKALSTYMGHASITITLDRYGHLLPGNEHQAATLLDTWLQTATSGT